MDYLEGIENPYSTFIAFNEGATQKQIAEAYWSDLIELLELPVDHGIQALEKARDTYFFMVEMLFDEGDVELIELRGYVYAVAVMQNIKPENREWLHDAFEWVQK